MILARWAIFILNHAFYMCICFFLKSPKELNKQSSNAQRTHDRLECTGTGTGAVQWIVLQCNAMHKKEATKTQHTRHRRQVKPDWDRHFTFFFFFHFLWIVLYFIRWLVIFSHVVRMLRGDTHLWFSSIFFKHYICVVCVQNTHWFRLIFCCCFLVWFGLLVTVAAAYVYYFV